MVREQWAARVLEIELDAEGDEIRQAYRRLIVAHHPDRFLRDPVAYARAERKAKKINLAFEILTNRASSTRVPDEYLREDLPEAEREQTVYITTRTIRKQDPRYADPTTNIGTGAIGGMVIATATGIALDFADPTAGGLYYTTLGGVAGMLLGACFGAGATARGEDYGQDEIPVIRWLYELCATVTLFLLRFWLPLSLILGLVALGYWLALPRAEPVPDPPRRPDLAAPPVGL